MIIAVWILFTISIVLVIVSLIMAPDAKTFSGALVGSSDLDLFKVSKERGAKKALKWIMFVFGIILMIGALIANALG